MNAILREQNGVISDSSGQESEVEAEQWDGIPEARPIDHEDEYADDDRFTTVTVEAVDVSKDGLRKVREDDDDDDDDEGGDTAGANESQQVPGRQSTAQGQGSEDSKRLWTKEPPKGLKKKKKKFRYESKAERKVTRYKERSGNKAKAKARRSA